MENQNKDCDFQLFIDTPPSEKVKTAADDVSSNNQTILKNCNTVTRKQNHQIMACKDSESKKREDLTSLGSDDSGKIPEFNAFKNYN